MKTKLLSLFIFYYVGAGAQTNVPGGNVYGAWTLAGSPYNVSGHITVPKDSTLTIQPGVNIVFQGHYKFNVRGRVFAAGTSSDTVVFTAADTSIGWWGMRYDSILVTQDSSLFVYCKLQYGKANTGTGNDLYGGAIMVNNFSKIRIANCMITNNFSSGGGGICFNSSNGTISNCTVSNNTASVSSANSNTYSYGGGIYFSSFSGTISNCTVSNNSVFSSSSNSYGSYSYGGGIYFITSFLATISNCTVSNNTASAFSSNSLYSSSYGGGIYFDLSAAFPPPTGGTITNCTISNNTCSNAYYSYGGGIYFSSWAYSNFAGGFITNCTIQDNSSSSGGGGIYFGSLHSGPVITNCIINNNTSRYGAGIDCSSYGGTITNSTISNNFSISSFSYGGGIYGGMDTIADCIISNNSSSYGGGVYSSSGAITNCAIINNTAFSSSEGGGGIYFLGSPTVTNCTIANNDATGTSGGGGGLFFKNNSDPDFINCILYGNTASSGNGANIYLYDSLSNPSFSYCDIQGSSAAIYNNSGTYSGSYTNNIDSVPLFVAPSAGAGTGFNGLIANWHLQTTSPCIDMGDPNNTIGFYPASDLGGNPRVVVCRIDMGAYEDQNGLPFLVSLSIQQNIYCVGNGNGAATVTVSNGTPPYTYSWSSGETTSAVTGLSAGTYTVIVTDAGNCSKTGIVTITQPNLIISMTSVQTACNANTGTASASPSGGTSPYTFIWNNGQTTSVTTGLGTGNYTVTITDANGCTKNAIAYITPKPSPNVTTSATQTNCSPSTGTAAATALGGASPYTYLWSDGQTTSVATALAAGSYTVVVTDSYGCTKTATVSVTQKSNPNVTTSTTQTNCSSPTGTATASVSGGTFPYTYLWSNNATTQQANNLAAGNYSVTVTDANGCTSSDSVTISQFPSVLTNQNVSICNGDSILVGGNYQTTAGTYNDTLQTVNGCDSVIVTALTINSLPSVSLSLNPDTVCISSGAYALTGGSPNGGIYSGAGVSAGNFNPSMAGNGLHNIIYTYTDANNCTNSDTAHVFVDLCTGVQTYFNSEEIIISPNPTTGIFTIQFADPSTLLKVTAVEITNLLGEKIYSSVINSSKSEIDLSKTSKGIYFIKVISEAGVVTRKLILQ
ncbi:MAG: right-handed parallel beta-helix repeat-containing protein [Bacteroidetes bacterium]|nr:right-handed parallel beta-helix repeat-containing protein [Bacteroidota bacterium]